MSSSITGGGPSHRYTNYLLALLMVILAFNFVDRLALGLLLQNIKIDLRLSDTQLGFLSGMAFFFFYSVMGIPIARLADRGNRVTIISLCAGIWSVLVVACGLAGSFVQLFAIRTGVAIGEAGCLPTSFSLISDNFTRAERPRASAKYTLGVSLGFLLGFFPAGWLNQAYGWRVTFMVMGLPGLVLALLARFTLREPRLGELKSRSGNFRTSVTQQADRREQSLLEVCRVLWKISSFKHLLVGYCVLFFFQAGLLQWQPTFFVRSFGLKSGELGTWLALMYGVGGLFGTYAGGVLATRVRRQLYLPVATFISSGLLASSLVHHRAV